MTRLVRSLLAATLLLGLTGVGRGEERFPPPDFTDHKLPATEVPAPESALGDYVDLGYLLVALSLASYFALGRRSRRGLFVLALVSLGWLGFHREGCICPIGAIQNVTLAIFDSTYAIPLSVVGFLVLPLVFTLFFGRTFCGAVCPLGAVQELVAIRPLRVPAWLDHALGLLAYIYLGAAVLFAATGTAFVICRYDPFVAFFRRTGSMNMLVYGGMLLVIGFFVGRPYCRYLCPLGAILGLCSKVSQRHLQIPPDECIQCRLCEDACPYGAILEPTIAQEPAERPRARRRLVMLLLLAPVLVVLGAWVGGRTSVLLARMHPAVRLAERVRLEETGQAPDTNDMSDAFRNTGRPKEELYREAVEHFRRFRWTGLWLGAWVGLVLGVKLVHLSIRRRRSDYRPDRAGCVSCGRCFWYCPVEQARLGLIQDLGPYRPDQGPPPAAPHEPQVTTTR